MRATSYGRGPRAFKLKTEIMNEKITNYIYFQEIR